jgi:hypothetical protein
MSEEKKSTMNVKGEELMNKVKDLLHEGNVRKIVISDDKDKQLLEIPLTLGVVGLMLAPLVAVLGTVGAMALNYKINVVRKEDSQDGPKPEKKSPS